MPEGAGDGVVRTAARPLVIRRSLGRCGGKGASTRESRPQEGNMKHGKLGESDVGEPMEGREADSQDAGSDAAAEEVAVASEKHGKKMKRKKSESEVNEDSKIISEEGSIGLATKESRKDEKNKKKKGKELNDKQITCSSLPEPACSELEGKEAVEDEGHKKGKCSENKDTEKEGANLHLHGREKRKKHKRLEAGGDLESIETNVLEKESVSRKRTGNDKELESEKPAAHIGVKESVEDKKKDRKKKKDKKERTILAENKELVGIEECQNLVNDSKKKKRKHDNVVPEKDENARKKVKQASITKDMETAKDDAGDLPSASVACDKKKKKQKKEKKDAVADGLEPSSEGTFNEGMDVGENISAEANGDKVDKRTSRARRKRHIDKSRVSQPKKRQKKSKKRVSFSGKVEVFPPCDETDDYTEKPLVQGKRFSPQEDELVKEAVLKYIEVNQLGEEGLRMVLNCSKYPRVRHCWKEIGASLHWRPHTAVYYRAHILFERSEERKWEPEEYEILRRFHATHGSDWKKLAGILGKHRFHVKDAWRRVGSLNHRKGFWSQEEYQTLFDLVNLDLKMKAFEEKKTKYGMLKDNISWEAISKKLTTRYDAACCLKWYQQLTSPLVNEGLWVDSDDYRLLDALQQSDACCMEDVDWDNLLEHRSEEICRRRWDQMTRHIGGHREKSFIEQVDVLAKRYCPEMLEYRE